LSLDDAVEYLGDDELLEVTPKNYRLRKRLLNQEERKRDQKRREMAMQNDD
jgi:GTP-binding protein